MGVVVAVFARNSALGCRSDAGRCVEFQATLERVLRAKFPVVCKDDMLRFHEEGVEHTVW